MGRFASGTSLGTTLLALWGCALLVSCSSGSSTKVSNNQVPAIVNLTPSSNASLEVGKFLAFTASAQNSAGRPITESFSFQSSAPNVVTVSSGGVACAGTWDSLTAPSVCTPGSTGTAQIIAVANGVPSAPVTIYVHQHVTSVVVTRVPNQPPTLSSTCLSKGAPGGPESTLYQAFAFNGNTDITSSVGPFTWLSAAPVGQTVPNSVTLISPGVTAPLNEQIAQATNPGSTFIFASVGSVNSQPLSFTTCPVQSIALAAANNSSSSSLTVSVGTSTTLNAKVTDSVGMPLTGVSLTWNTSNPVSVGVSGASSTVFGGTASVTSPAVGSGAITASCTPPNCNGGITPSMPIYPKQAISFTVTPGSTSTSNSPTVYVSSKGCSATTVTCITTVVPITRSSNTAPFTAGKPVPLTFTPNSARFDRTGGNEFFGVDSVAFGTKGAMVVSNGTNVTPLQNVAGTVLAISPDGSSVIFSDTVDSPQQVIVCTNCSSSGRALTPLLFSGATAAAFSPDNLKAYIVSGSSCPATASAGCLLIFSRLDSPQWIPLQTPATGVAFVGNGTLGYIAGGDPAGGAFLPTCIRPASTGLPSGSGVGLASKLLLPLPDGQSVLGLSVPNLETVTATISGSPSTGASGCPAPRGFLTISNAVNGVGNLGLSNFTPSQFFLSPDGMTAYILGAPNLTFVIQFNLNTGIASNIALAGNATPLSASLSPDGSLLFVGASDGAVHVINTSTLADNEQVTFPFPQNSLCIGPGTPVTPAPVPCNPDLVLVRP